MKSRCGGRTTGSGAGGASGWKISSMARSKSLAIAKASGRLGSYLPVSMALTDCRYTPSCSANSPCDHPRMPRNSRSWLVKDAFHNALLSQATLTSYSCTVYLSRVEVTDDDLDVIEDDLDVFEDKFGVIASRVPYAGRWSTSSNCGGNARSSKYSLSISSIWNRSRPEFERKSLRAFTSCSSMIRGRSWLM